MRNRFAGPCYRCGGNVPAGAGHFERTGHKWRVIHAKCVFEQRAEKAKAIRQ
jgi:hypothetical protein